jgi:hypothetical protein
VGQKNKSAAKRPMIKIEKRSIAKSSEMPSIANNI